MTGKERSNTKRDPMEQKQYNFEEYSEDELSKIILYRIFDELETKLHDKLPSNSTVVAMLRSVGWEKKVRVGDNCNHSIDGLLEEVGVCVYMGHSQAAFVKILAMQSLYEDGIIKECYLITQTEETAELRHKLVNPSAKAGTNGNRITFTDLINGMSYYHRFITVPITVIGLELRV